MPGLQIKLYHRNVCIGKEESVWSAWGCPRLQGATDCLGHLPTGDRGHGACQSLPWCNVATHMHKLLLMNSLRGFGVLPRPMRLGGLSAPQLHSSPYPQEGSGASRALRTLPQEIWSSRSLWHGAPSATQKCRAGLLQKAETNLDCTKPVKF